MTDNRKPRATVQPKLVAEMTFEQAEMKRASDRVHQRYSRARRQNRIAELEHKNATLTSQLMEMEKQLQEMRKSEESLQLTTATTRVIAPQFDQSSAALATTNLTQDHEGKARINGRTLLPRTSSSSSNINSSTSASMSSPLIGCLTQNLNSSMSCFLDVPLDFGTSLAIDLLEDISGGRNTCTTFPEENYVESLPWLICNQFQKDSSLYLPIDREIQDRDALEIERQPSSTLGPRISEWSQAEQLISVHLPPTTPTDHVLIEVSEFGRRWSQQKGQQYEELYLPNYPDLSSLLKPTSRDAALSPIASAVGKHSAWATSVHSLASRVAYHYMVAQMIRWMICRTEQSYNQLPPFLRPTELQRIVPHPAWVDVFFW
jgi:hypothetical protein